MNIMINSICNLKCPYCFASDSMESNMKEEMSIENFNYILQFLKNSNIDNVKLVGGEPTLHSNIYDLINMTIEKNFKNITLFTNGLYSSKFSDYLSKIEDLIDLWITVNLNMPEQIGAKNFEKILYNIERLNTKNRLILGVNLYKADLDLQSFKDAVLKYNIKQIRWVAAVPNLKGLTKFDTESYYKSLIPVTIDLLSFCYKNNIRPNADCHKIPLCYFDFKSLQKMLVYDPGYFISKKCSPPMSIYPDLSIIRCFATNDIKISKLTDFKTTEQILLHFLMHIDKKYDNYSKKSSKCKECPILHNECRDGCINLLALKDNVKESAI